MKITAVRYSMLENPEGSGRAGQIVRVPELRRRQRTHTAVRHRPGRQASINVPIASGHIAPPDGRVWGGEWDGARFRSPNLATRRAHTQ